MPTAISVNSRPFLSNDHAATSKHHHHLLGLSSQTQETTKMPQKSTQQGESSALCCQSHTEEVSGLCHHHHRVSCAGQQLPRGERFWHLQFPAQASHAFSGALVPFPGAQLGTQGLHVKHCLSRQGRIRCVCIHLLACALTASPSWGQTMLQLLGGAQLGQQYWCWECKVGKEMWAG